MNLVDLRRVRSERRIQALRFPTENAWDEIVRAAITEITRNQVVVSRSFAELTTPQGRSNLKQLLSFALAERGSGFGILVNVRFGVFRTRMIFSQELALGRVTMVPRT
jgi:hypothetical protein